MNEIQDVVANTGTIADSFLERVLDLLTHDVLTVAGFALAGMLIGIASTYGVRMCLGELSRPMYAIQRFRERRNLVLTRWAFATGALWTFILVWWNLSLPYVPRAAVALGAASVAGAGTPWLFDVLKAGHRWVLGWIARKRGVGR